MHVSKAAGIALVILGAAAAAVVLAPGVDARQAAGGPRLGVSIRDVMPEDVAKLKLSGQAGVVVEDVTKDSAAAKAGLKAGDAIVQFDGENVRSARQLTRLVTESAVGRAIRIGIVRDGKRTDVEATLTEAGSSSAKELSGVVINRDEIKREVERGLAEAQPMIRQFRLERRPNIQGYWSPGPPNGMPEPAMPFMYSLTSRGRLGVTIQELTPDLAAYFGVKEGVLVSSVSADTPAAKAGIKAGDVITAVDDKAIKDGAALVSQLSAKEGDVTIAITRDRKAMSVKANVGKPEQPKRKVVIRGIGA